MTVKDPAVSIEREPAADLSYAHVTKSEYPQKHVSVK